MDTGQGIGFVYNQRVSEAADLVRALVERLQLGKDTWIRSALDMEQESEGEAPGVGIIITVGGDGTILRAARIAAPHAIPILGINMGRVGFMTELNADEALDSILHYLDGGLRVEERAMLQARVSLPSTGPRLRGGPKLIQALNDVVVGSRGAARMVAIQVSINGAMLTEHHADAVIVATATGSTGYALSAGGPIMHPLSHDLVLKPVAAHLGLSDALVLPSDTLVELVVRSDQPTNLNADGFVEQPLEEGARIEVTASPHQMRFLRKSPPDHYYLTLTQRLRQPGGLVP